MPDEDEALDGAVTELDSEAAKDMIHTKANKLKQATGEFNQICIKKNVHPSVRGEWKRLREPERTEPAQPENAGCVIRLIRGRRNSTAGVCNIFVGGPYNQLLTPSGATVCLYICMSRSTCYLSLLVNFTKT